MNRISETDLVKILEMKENSTSWENLEARIKRCRLQKQQALELQINSLLENPVSFDGNTGVNQIVLTELPDNPFTVSQKAYQLALEITQKTTSAKEKAYAIFRWMQENISYDNQYSYTTEGYHNADQVLKKRKGVCGELAYLYICLARAAGLAAKWVDVKIDNLGKRVDHACAAVIIDKKAVLVDPAYSTFDIKHQKFQILDDADAWNCYKLMK